MYCGGQSIGNIESCLKGWVFHARVHVLQSKVILLFLHHFESNIGVLLSLKWKFCQYSDWRRDKESAERRYGKHVIYAKWGLSLHCCTHNTWVSFQKCNSITICIDVMYFNVQVLLDVRLNLFYYTKLHSISKMGNLLFKRGKMR